MSGTTVRTAILACLAFLSICATAQEPVTIRMHGVLRSRGNYLLHADAEKFTGKVYEGHPAIVKQVRDASKDPLRYCLLVDGAQKPPLDAAIRHAAADLVHVIARPGDRGRVIVYGKSMKASKRKDWDSDANAVAAFVSTPLKAKESDPYSALLDCAEQFEKSNDKGEFIRTIFLVGGLPTESTPWTTEWFLERFARLDVQLYLVSYDPGLSTGGEQKYPEAQLPRGRGRVPWPPRVPPATAPRMGGWYAPSLYRVARGSVGDVIFASPKQSPDFAGWATRLRNEVAITLAVSERDANTYRDFRLAALDIEVQAPNVLYVPKR